MITRRIFIKGTAVVIAALSIACLLSCEQNDQIKEIKVISYNVLKCTGWPVERVPDSSLIPELIAMELSKYSPDIINFSESPDETVIRHIAKLLNMNYVFFSTAGNWPGAIITRFEILESANMPLTEGVREEDLFTRHWGSATIKISNNQSLIVHSAHLYPHDNPVSSSIRQREITEILKTMSSDIEKNRSILVIGDLNHTPDMTEYSQWVSAGFTDSFVSAGKGDGFTVRADTPNKRIDYILAHGPISKKITESRALYEGGFRVDPADTNTFALSDHLPQFATFHLK